MKTITINVPDDCKVQIVKKEEKPIIRTYQDLIDNGKTISKGYWIGRNSLINEVLCYTINQKQDRNIASSEKVAKSMLAMAQISQLMPYYGGEITDDEWISGSLKFGIIAGKDANNNLTIIRKSIFTMKLFLAFHTAEQRDEFLKWNLDLVKDYLMIND